MAATPTAYATKRSSGMPEDRFVLGMFLIIEKEKRSVIISYTQGNVSENVRYGSGTLGVFAGARVPE